MAFKNYVSSVSHVAESWYDTQLVKGAACGACRISQESVVALYQELVEYDWEAASKVMLAILSRVGGEGGGRGGGGGQYMCAPLVTTPKCSLTS